MLNRLRVKHDYAPLGDALFWEFARVLILIFNTLFYRIRYHGKHNIPRRGPFLLICNHESHLDPPAVGTGIATRAVNIVARAGLFDHKGFGWMISALHAIPIDDEGGPDTRAIRETLRRLKAGGGVLIFPEGTRTPDGEIKEFKRGIALLVKKAECPVIPAAIHGAYEAMPRHRKLPRLLGQRIAVAYGAPIQHNELMARGPDAAIERLRAEVADLYDQLHRRR